MIGTIFSFMTGGGLFGIVSTVVRFLTHPAGIVVIAIGVLWYARHDARMEERELCEARNRAAEAALLEERAAASGRVQEAARRAASEYQERVDALEKELNRHETDGDGGNCLTDPTFFDSLPTQRRD